ncbi:hypothetical protein PHYC_03503 [Phycisphaerales bacterium]|nr:hypothetical protein PHYC_03503 [Phycisphaerales bacterium]
MTRTQLEHIIRAAWGITGEREFVVIGSQAILGQFPDAPRELLYSMEADLFSMRDATTAELIEGTIGEESPFHETFGYHAHGVGEESATLPQGWKDRLIPVRTPEGATGWCLEVHDLAISKLIAGREKDVQFLSALIKHRLADPGLLRARLDATTAIPEIKAAASSRLARILASAK